MWQNAVCSKHYISTELLSWKKNVSASSEREILCEASLNCRIAVKKSMLRKQINVKRLQSAQVLKGWTMEQRNKVLWTDESKYDIFWSNRKVCVAKSWRKSYNHQYHTNRKAWRRLSNGVGGEFCQLRCQGFASGEEQTESNWLLQHNTVSCDPAWNLACRSRICAHAR